MRVGPYDRPLLPLLKSGRLRELIGNGFLAVLTNALLKEMDEGLLVVSRFKGKHLKAGDKSIEFGKGACLPKHI